MPATIAFLQPGDRVPNADRVGPHGLVAVGGDLRPATLIDAYGKGIFPWYEQAPILWFSPDPRMVLLPEELRISRSVRRALHRNLFEVRFDTAFDRVIAACAAVARPEQSGTWINADMVRAYGVLHRHGYAHSCEVWRDGRLAGGLYGVSLGGAFFGESMFSLEPDASKVAFIRLVERLRDWSFALVDCQIHTDHLARFGARELPRDQFLHSLAGALRLPTRRGSWST
jgi:leucyl/phenylalanyl-tRNA--protein transferase